ncbi:GSCFA family protein, partial [bacterium]
MSPYDTLGEKSFWRRAVAETHPFSWTDLYEKKFEIGRTDKVATAGSCFAQHIGNRMSRSGFAYIDAEPAPPLLSASERKSSGYGLYSARYGNIYTTRQLRQLLEEAYGLREPAERVWRSKDRYYDPFRPSIEPNGVSTEDEVLGMRQGQHLPAVRYCVERASVFVFTLGLTEAWSSRSDGSIYQVCPGTTPGTEDVWDADKYEFINFGFREVIADLEAAVFLMREKNPKLRVILTVSPVPLTATASGDHVLSATIYSKSVLRAVAGELAKTHEFIDYFPS